MKRPLRVGAAVATTALLATTLAAGTVSAAPPSGRATLPGSVPPWATAASFKQAADATGHVGFRVYLSLRNEAAATALANAVSDPRNPQYGHFLTPAQFDRQFAPTQAQVNAVSSWLRSQGFTIDAVPSNNHYVEAEGTVAQAEAAFDTTLGEYSVDGMLLRSPETDLSVPGSLSDVVSVIGLDDSAAFVHPDHIVADAPPSGAFVNAPPCSSYWGANTSSTGADGTPIPEYPTGTNTSVQPAWAPCGYTPTELQDAYGVSGAIASGNDGSGVTVAIIDAFASPTILQDVNTYSSLNALPEMTPGQFKQVVPPGIFRHPESGVKNPHFGGPIQDPQGWYGEETLDVEAVHTMAPGANIVFVGAPNSFQDLDAALNYVVANHVADIVTNSYGFLGEFVPKGYIIPYLDTMIQGADEGIGIYFSSGDEGDTSRYVGVPSPDWPASSPYVTAVGGTSLGLVSDNSIVFQSGWETGKSALDTTNSSWKPAPPGNFVYGSGGGTSRLFAQPSYQAGVVPSSMSMANDATQPMRVVPDVSMVGDPNTGMLIGQTQTFPTGVPVPINAKCEPNNPNVCYAEYRIGGTSLSSPLFAGMMALVQQKAGHDIGFANPLIYENQSAFSDVVAPSSPTAVARADYGILVGSSDQYVYSLRSMEFDALAPTKIAIHVGPGYDNVTGIGSPNPSSFLSDLSAGTP